MTRRQNKISTSWRGLSTALVQEPEEEEDDEREEEVFHSPEGNLEDDVEGKAEFCLSEVHLPLWPDSSLPRQRALSSEPSLPSTPPRPVPEELPRMEPHIITSMADMVEFSEFESASGWVAELEEMLERPSDVPFDPCRNAGGQPEQTCIPVVEESQARSLGQKTVLKGRDRPAKGDAKDESFLCFADAYPRTAQLYMDRDTHGRCSVLKLTSALLGFALAGSALVWMWPLWRDTEPTNVQHVEKPLVAKLWQTAKLTDDWLTPQMAVPVVSDFPHPGPVVEIGTATRQAIVGFGGAFTETSALVFANMTQHMQERVLELYFGPTGIGYTFGRVHINSCDFSVSSYTFDDVTDDFNLLHFDMNVERDTRALIPFILRAQAKLEAHGRTLKLLASPWSPPAWMKSNGKMGRSYAPGLREGSQYHGAWASYIMKWVTAYESQSVPIWGITAQNEPENNATWEACLYTPEQMADWVADYLGPVLRLEHPEVKLFVYDHNKDHVYKWANVTYSHPQALQFVTGIAFHWYAGDHFDQLARIRAEYPEFMLLPTEATWERYRWAAGTTVEEGDWNFGMAYAHDILGDLNAGSVGWTDWNLLLDESGGPNHMDNSCDGAMLYNCSSGELYIHPQYYFMGHFSRYISPGSHYLPTVVHNTTSYAGKNRPYGVCSGEDGLEAAAFLRPDRATVAVVLNCGTGPVDYKIVKGKQAINATIPAYAVQTYMFRT